MTSVRCPEIGQFRAFLYEDYKGKSHVIIDGDWRQFIYSKAGKSLQCIPRDIVRLITNYFIVEYVHLMKVGEDGEHWKICLQDVLP